MTSVLDRRNQVVGALHAALYRATNGRVGGRIGQAQVVLVTTTGRRSGQPHAVPLMAFADADRIVLVASNGGQDKHPAWYLNALANPAVTVRRGDDTHVMRARIATPAEKAELWPRIVEWWDRYDAYQRKTTRDIPLLLLE
jgi:deazaflavin-dependent oxidoreductase (nitroreductase family)